MNRNRVRRVLAIIALVFMVIASVTLVIVFINPNYLHGAFGYMALISFLLGVGFFVIVKFVLKEADATPEYLPSSDNDDESDDGAEAADNTEEQHNDDRREESESENSSSD